MLYVPNNYSNDPQMNLAIEEYLLRREDITDDILLFYINKPSIIIGRNQNTTEEINTSYVEEHDIQVVRRLSGGGAVYHDLGNLNFSFITNKSQENTQNFKKFTKPVIEALDHLGVQAELSGRNDILVNGAKVSGNAQFNGRTRMFSHGTLLYNADLSNVAKALNVKPSKIESKGVKSVRSRVANISEFLPDHLKNLHTEEFRDRIRDIILQASTNNTYTLTDRDWDGIEALMEDRYNNWEWNYGKSPKSNVTKEHRFPFGEIEAKMQIDKGIIQSIKIYGDFLGNGNVADIETRLTQQPYQPQAMRTALADLTITPYFNGLTNDEFVDFLY